MRSWWLRFTPFWLVVFLVGLAAMLIVVPFGLRWWNDGRVEFPADAVRVPEYVLNPAAVPEKIEGQKRYRITSWEPEWKAVYETNLPQTLGAFGLSQSTVMPAKTSVFTPMDEIQIPGGFTWKPLLIYVAVRPEPTTLDFDLPMITSAKGQAYEPNLQPMSEEQLNALYQVTPGEIIQTFVNDTTIQEGNIGVLKLIMEVKEEENSEYRFTGSRSLRDSRTGFKLGQPGSENHYGFSSSEGKTNIVNFEFHIKSWYAGPSAFWFEYYGNVKNELVFQPIPGSIAIDGSRKIVLEEIWSRTNSGWEILTTKGKRPVTEKETNIISDQLNSAFMVSIVSTSTNENFANLKNEYPKLNPIGDDGKLLQTEYQMRSSQLGNELLFAYNLNVEQIQQLRLEHIPELERVAIKIPFIPELPEQNRNVKDFQDVYVPYTTVRNDFELGNFFVRELQTESISSITISNSNIISKTYPITHRKFNVGDYFKQLRKNSDVVVQVKDLETNEDWFALTRPGLSRQWHGTWLARNLNFLLNPRFILVFLIYAFFPLIIWSLIQAYQLRNHLRSLGYKTYGYRTAWRLWFFLGRKSWRIPEAEELAIIPGFNVEKPSSILRIMRDR